MSPIDRYSSQFAELRPKLVAFSMLQVTDKSLAEDIVQDTMIAALESLESFSGDAKFETWVYGILKFKLIDHLRRTTREQGRFIVESDCQIDNLFDDRDHWSADSTPSNWLNPEEHQFQDHFWKVFDICLIHLPTSTARIFALRELMDLETSEICTYLDISEQNCWTTLHRARLKLRDCLEKGWLHKEECR